MSAQLETLLTRWDSDEGKPYKGSLFDFSSFDGDEGKPTDNLSCMCAQGQVLAIAGGWVPEQFRSVSQNEADGKVAELLNISRAHSVLLRNINDSASGAPSIVLRDPEKVLGDQWSKLLDFWWMIDQFDEAQWDATWPATWTAAWIAASSAARDTAGGTAGDAAGDTTSGAAGLASWEIQGFELLAERGRNVFFLPMFGIQTLSDIPARPADYGLGFVPQVPA